MANVFNKTTYEYRRSVNTPDFSPTEWAINPDVSDLLTAGVPQKYWKWDALTSRVVEMSQAEKDARDAGMLPTPRAFVERLDENQPITDEDTEVYLYTPERGVAYVEYLRFATSTSALHLSVEIDGQSVLEFDLNATEDQDNSPLNWPSVIRRAFGNQWLVQPGEPLRVLSTFRVLLRADAGASATLTSGEVSGRSGFHE